MTGQTVHTRESLMRQMETIERMMEECKGKTGLERLLKHLEGRRDVTQYELSRLENQSRPGEI